MKKITKGYRVLIAAALVCLVCGWLEMPRHLVDPYAPIPESIRSLFETQALLGQTAPSANIPVNPANLYGAAVVGYATTTGGGAMTLITAATGHRFYIYEADCVNTSSTGVAALVKDNTNTYAAIPCPANAASLGVTSFNPPIKMVMGSAATMTATTSESTLYFHMSGYYDLR
jgi:hypothetical protein